MENFVVKNGVLTKYTGEEASVTIPNTVRKIGEKAFEFTKVESVTIPDTVTSIGSDAFYECEKLEKVVIPDNIKK